MSSRGIILWLLVTNAAALLALGYLGVRPRDPVAAAPVPRTANLPAPRPGTHGPTGAVASVTQPAPRLDWRDVESADYRTYIANLRSIGCPEETIRDLIIADVSKLFASRMAAANGPKPSRKYWEAEPYGKEVEQRERYRRQRELDLEKKTLLRELLGVDFDREMARLNGREDFYDQRLGFLPEEKRSQIRALMDKYQDMEQRWREKQWDEGEDMTADDRAQLRRLREERKAEIAKLMSPAELEQYELWTSPAANTARWQMGGMEPTEQEFLALYQLRKNFEETFHPEDMDPHDKAMRERTDKASKQLEEQLKTQLGPARYADYQRGQDYEYRQLNELAARYNLPKETAVKVYDMKKLVEEQRQKLAADSSLSAEQRTQALKAIGVEAERAVREAMGEKGYKLYRRRGGHWLQVPGP